MMLDDQFIECLLTIIEHETKKPAISQWSLGEDAVIRNDIRNIHIKIGKKIKVTLLTSNQNYTIDVENDDHQKMFDICIKRIYLYQEEYARMCKDTAIESWMRLNRKLTLT